jgi:hypothetical protein
MLIVIGGVNMHFKFHFKVICRFLFHTIGRIPTYQVDNWIIEASLKMWLHIDHTHNLWFVTWLSSRVKNHFAVGCSTVAI